MSDPALDWLQSDEARLKIIVVWDVTPYSLVDLYRRSVRLFLQLFTAVALQGNKTFKH
jgi:hypothetical protein